eukprot:CAMPEP_0185040100 /NCGR_PEP_ID=MMETSP1103-20130426/37763_1 /TAXON_ID=36769 /ORGANISM="Paraphysomonas bandaiensis, Strain Caron Lab Isolate" /LENGTH=377 /DNA_ID=CAMNT_0027579265 /DNA_START=76 /DNA_END=1206 /DNA_ORIENTATION=-
MDELIRFKLAELEENFQSDVSEQNLMKELSALDKQLSYDDSDMCRSFDYEVIDERKPLDERIRSVRDLFVNKIRDAKAISTEYSTILADCRNEIQKNILFAEEQKRLKKEKKALEDVRVKLQELCRLITKQTKDIVEENERLREIDRVRMDDLIAHFSTTIVDIKQKVADQEEEQMKKAEDNNQLREKITQFQEHSKLRDSHFKSQIHAKNLELQLAQAKKAQETQLLKQERARGEAYRADITHLSSSKAELKAQLALYSDKFDNFQEALNKSQGMFSQFEDKMQSMADTVCKLEGENARLRQECNRLDCTLVNQVEKKIDVTKRLEKLTKEKEKVAAECRRLQLQRGSITEKLSKLKGDTTVEAVAGECNPDIPPT